MTKVPKLMINTISNMQLKLIQTEPVIETVKVESKPVVKRNNTTKQSVWVSKVIESSNSKVQTYKRAWNEFKDTFSSGLGIFAGSPFSYY